MLSKSPSRLTGAAALCAVVLMVPSFGRACTTPVYRYAMYNWATSPYVVLYFYRGEQAEEDAKINARLQELSREQPPANVIFEPVDLDGENPLDGYPPPVKEAWEAHAGDEVPMHLVMTPWLVELFAGRLGETDLQAMTESPMRTQIAELIHQGNASVLLFVPGKDPAENERARKEIESLISQASSGEFGFGSMFGPEPPLAEPPAASAEASADAPEVEESPDAADESGGLKLATVELDSSDPAETWLVRSLMSVEPDLKEYVDEPMVFAVYGRARAMPPYIGKGITSDLLFDVVAFLAGPCSCFAKAENPGMDLLVRWDWEATADHRAANDPSLYPDPMMYQDYAAEGPAEVVPDAEDAAEEAAVAGEEAPLDLAMAAVQTLTDEGQPPQEMQPAVSEPARSEPAEAGPAEQTSADATTTVEPSQLSAPTPAGKDVGQPSSGATPPSGADRDSGGYALNFTTRLVVGLILGAIIVVGASLMVIRRSE